MDGHPCMRGMAAQSYLGLHHTLGNHPEPPDESQNIVGMDLVDHDVP